MNECSSSRLPLGRDPCCLANPVTRTRIASLTGQPNPEFWKDEWSQDRKAARGKTRVRMTRSPPAGAAARDQGADRCVGLDPQDPDPLPLRPPPARSTPGCPRAAARALRVPPAPQAPPDRPYPAGSPLPYHRGRFFFPGAGGRQSKLPSSRTRPALPGPPPTSRDPVDPGSRSPAHVLVASPAGRSRPLGAQRAGAADRRGGVDPAAQTRARVLAGGCCSSLQNRFAYCQPWPGSWPVWPPERQSGPRRPDSAAFLARRGSSGRQGRLWCWPRSYRPNLLTLTGLRKF